MMDLIFLDLTQEQLDEAIAQWRERQAGADEGPRLGGAVCLRSNYGNKPTRSPYCPNCGVKMEAPK